MQASVGTMHTTYQARYGRAISSVARGDASEGSPPYPKTLGDFWYLGKDWLEDEESAGGSEIPSGPALDIGLGGAGQILICLRGRWIMGRYH